MHRVLYYDKNGDGFCGSNEPMDIRRVPHH